MTDQKSMALAAASATPKSGADAFLASISTAAANPAVDAEKMGKLWALYKEMESLRDEREFNDAMRAVQAEIPAIFKNKKADKHTYANLELLLETITPIYTKHGFSLSYGNEDCPIENYYRVVCFVSHSGGHTRKYQADIPRDVSGSKNPTQGFGSTIAYGRRYLALMIFNVATTDDDGMGANGAEDKLSGEQQAQINKLLSDAGLPIEPLLKWAKVSALGDIPAERFPRVLEAVKTSVNNSTKTKQP